MMTIKRICVCVMAMTMVLAIGCERPSGPTNGSKVAVVDLDAVSKAIGRDALMKKQITETQKKIDASLTKQLQSIAVELKAKLDEEKAKFGDKPTDEQSAKLGRMTAQANRQMQILRQLAQQRAAQAGRKVRSALIAQFRAQIRPTIDKIAKGKGVSVVLTPTGSLMWFESSADLTDEVISDIRANGLPPAPQIRINTGAPATTKKTPDAPKTPEARKAPADPAPKKK